MVTITKVFFTHCPSGPIPAPPHPHPSLGSHFDLILIFSFDFSSLLSFIHFKEAFQKFHISLLFNFHCVELIHMVE